MSQGLTNRNDANLIVSLRIHDGYDNPFEESKRDVARFAIVFANILDRDQRTIEDSFGITKVDAVRSGPTQLDSVSGFLSGSPAVNDSLKFAEDGVYRF